MLRNCAKITFCGLVLTVCNGCHNTHPLMINVDGQKAMDLARFKISAPTPLMEYNIRRELAASLVGYSEKLRDYTIVINIKSESDVAAFSDKEVVKEQIRFVCSVRILNKELKQVMEKHIESFSTYEVNDAAPFADVSSKSAAVQHMCADLSACIVNLILVFIYKSGSR